MIQNTYKKIFLVIFLGLILFSFCRNPKSVELKNEEIFFTPRYYFKTINIPEKMLSSPDSVAQMARSLTLEYNAISVLVDKIQVDMKEIDSAYPWTRQTVNENGVKEILKIYKQGKSQYIWELTYDGVDNNSGIEYDSWLFLEAEVTLGDDGTFVVYEQNSIWPKYVHSLFKSYSNQAGYMLMMYNSEGLNKDLQYSLDSKIETVSLYYHKYIKNSGTAKFWYHIFWDREGNGNWVLYDDDNNEIDTGSW